MIKTIVYQLKTKSKGQKGWHKGCTFHTLEEAIEEEKNIKDKIQNVEVKIREVIIYEIPMQGVQTFEQLTDYNSQKDN